MPTTQDDIRRWLKEAKKNKATHMLVCTDTFDYSDYPIEVSKNENVRDVYKEHQGPNMQKVMEVYNLSMNIEYQLSENRSMHFDNDTIIENKEPFLNKK